MTLAVTPKFRLLIFWVTVERVSLEETLMVLVKEPLMVLAAAVPAILRSWAVEELVSVTVRCPLPVELSVSSSPSPVELMEAVTSMFWALMSLMTSPRVRAEEVRLTLTLAPAALVILKLPWATPLPPL